MSSKEHVLSVHNKAHVGEAKMVSKNISHCSQSQSWLSLPPCMVWVAVINEWLHILFIAEEETCNPHSGCMMGMPERYTSYEKFEKNKLYPEISALTGPNEHLVLVSL